MTDTCRIHVGYVSDTCQICGCNLDSEEPVSFVEHLNAEYVGFAEEGFIAKEHTIEAIMMVKKGKGEVRISVRRKLGRRGGIAGNCKGKGKGPKGIGTRRAKPRAACQD